MLFLDMPAVHSQKSCHTDHLIPIRVSTCLAQRVQQQAQIRECPLTGQRRMTTAHTREYTPVTIIIFYGRTLFTASTKEVFCFEAAMTAPPTGTIKFLSVDCTTASTLPLRQAAVTCKATSQLQVGRIPYAKENAG